MVIDLSEEFAEPVRRLEARLLEHPEGDKPRIALQATFAEIFALGWKRGQEQIAMRAVDLGLTVDLAPEAIEYDDPWDALHQGSQ